MKNYRRKKSKFDSKFEDLIAVEQSFDSKENFHRNAPASVDRIKQKNNTSLWKNSSKDLITPFDKSK